MCERICTLPTGLDFITIKAIAPRTYPEYKIVERATIAVPSAICEETSSDGFRPKRGQHDALQVLVVEITTKKVNFIFDGDIGQFDSGDQA